MTPKPKRVTHPDGDGKEEEIPERDSPSLRKDHK